MTIRRTLTAVLAAAALVAPAAQAEPPDMHASTAQAAAKARAEAQPKQDLRSPDARDAARTHRRSGHAVNAPGATALDSASQLPPAGQPTWPTNPTPLVAPAQEPVTDGDGSPVPVIPLVAGVLVALIAALAARHAARRGSRHARVAA
jgi:hypothetical protein